MKRNYLYLTLIAFAAFSLTSCDDDEKAPEQETGIVGTWEGEADEYHYPVVTFNADGTYEWEWAGIHKMKDTGKYTYEEGKRIVMNPSKYYEYDDEKGEYVTGDPGYTGDRNCRIIEINPGMMRVNLNDYFMGGGQGEGFDFTLYRKGYVQDIKTKDLEGTWESYESDGSLSTRIVISGSNYTAYDVWTVQDTILCAEKSTGTWSVKNSVMTVKPSENLFSYDRVNNDYVYSVVDPETLEAEKWTGASWTQDEYTQKIYLSDDKKTLYAGGVKFTKK